MELVEPDNNSQLLNVKRCFYSLLKRHLGQDFYSQATQDLFVLKMLSKKTNGYYLEVGGGDPEESSNTFLLEKLGWNGVSLEYDAGICDKFSRVRKNSIVCTDATVCDYRRILEEHGAPLQLDYLSLDIDPPQNTFRALERLPHSEYRFSVITYEHDRYRSGDEFMLRSREFLKGLGYHRVVGNVRVFGRDFEDWWVDPTVVDERLFRGFFAGGETEFSSLWT